METFALCVGNRPVDSPHKGQWRVALMLYLICVWTNGWANTRDARHLRRNCTHYDMGWYLEHVWNSDGCPMREANGWFRSLPSQSEQSEMLRTVLWLRKIALSQCIKTVLLFLDFGYPTTDEDLIPFGPYFELQPQDVVYEPISSMDGIVLDQTSLECRVRSNPPPTYHWKKTRGGVTTEISTQEDPR